MICHPTECQHHDLPASVSGHTYGTCLYLWACHKSTKNKTTLNYVDILKRNKIINRYRSPGTFLVPGEILRGSTL